MSLHKFAEQVASQGRGDDSLLVHMTPDEVQRLQSFAQANGRSLTINPTTGLPEAGMLSDLFKAIAPIALGAFLGPAGLGMSSMMAGVATGGITTLATGSLSRGLMAGLGAYGGAGLGESFMTAGGGMSAANAATAAQGQLGATNLALGEALPAQAAEQFTQDAVARMTPSGAVSAGFNKAIASPGAAMDFAKGNLGNLAYAAAPIAAGLMVPTTTKMPDAKDTGYIRQFDYNINPETGRPDPLYGMRAMTPVKASDFGNKTFQGQRDLFRQQNPNPYELGVGSLNQPPQQQPARMDTGGIVALAGGGDVKHFAIGDLVKADIDKAYAAGDYAKVNELAQANKITAADVADTYKGFDASGLTAKGINLFTAPVAPPIDYNKLATNYVTTAATPTATTADFVGGANTAGIGLTQPLATALQNSGLSAAAQYALTHSNIGPDVNKEETYGGLKGLSSNINYLASQAQDQISKGMLTGAQARENALTEMNTYGINDADIFRATGKTLKELFPDTTTKVVLPPPVSVVPGGTQLPGATVYNNGAYGNYGSGPATGVDYKGNTVSIATPGDIISNPDGTRTVVPNVPGRPYGGFTGMEGVKSAYTAGGGSLGYTAPVPKTPAEHNATYNKMTDDSLDAYNFLMGKGKNLTQRKAETRDRPVMQRYDEAVLGRKAAKLTKPGTTTTKTVTGVPGNPQSYFNEAEYLAANPDVAAELKTGKSVSGQPTLFTSGYEHYLMYGKGKRAFTGDYEGYLTAAALANSAGAGGGGGPGSTASTSSNTGNTISGFNPAAPDSTISVTDAVASPASSATPSGGSTSVGSSVSGDPGGAPSGGDGDGDGDGDGGVGDARGGYYSRGKLNYGAKNMAVGGYALGGLGSLGSYSDGGRLLKGPGDGVSDSIPATIGRKNQPARLADGEFVIPARIVSELGNGSTDAGAKKLYAMMDRVQRARGKTTGRNKVAANSRSDKYLPA